MHRSLRLALVAIASVTATLPAAPLPRSTPEAEGIPTTAVAAFLAAADRLEDVHSVMILRHGKVVAEAWWAPYRADLRHELYSLSKSFTSTAVGLAIAEGRLTLDDRVVDHFPDELPPEPSPNLRAMRVRDLLTMSTGHATEPPRPADASWTKAFLAHDVPFKPGTHFLYNTSATFMQAALVEKTTGEGLLAYLEKRLLGPLGIEDATWERNPDGIATGGYGLSLRTEDIARFGQLLLQQGRWDDRQIVPEEWIAQATGKQVSNGSSPDSDWEQGYGFQFWRCRHDAFRGDGAFGQFCIVLPEQDVVVAMTAGLGPMHELLAAVWDHLLPAIGDEPLPADVAAREALEKTIRSLSVTLPTSNGTGGSASGRTYRFPANPLRIETVRVAPAGTGDAERLELTVAGDRRTILCGRDAWLGGTAIWTGGEPQPAAAAGGWDGDSFTARICFVETPYVGTLRLAFQGDAVTLTGGMNVGFGPTKLPSLEGRADPAAP